ncbi:MAG: TonB-dependent receptor [Pseudomonadales bacterium]|nr:TonB-dependent receptor [Pseudomonadales bacterium]
MSSRNGKWVALLVSVALPLAHHAQAQDIELQEIVVTARKRDESLLKIPVSVSAKSQAQLQRAGIDSPEELSFFVPGLDFQGSTASGGRQNPSISFRGMIQQTITPSTQTGALFWDGSYVGGGGGFLPLVDVERVEVIKGPQTAQFGRNTFSGAVNIIPRLPGAEWERNIALEYSGSQEDEYKIEFGVGGPLNDMLGLRLYAGHQKDGGDFDTQDGEPYAVFSDTTFSGTLTIDPNDQLRLKLTGYYVTADDSGTSIGIDSGLWGTPAGQCDRTYTGEYVNIVTGVRTPFSRDLRALPFATFCGKFPDGEHLVAPLTLHPTLAQSSSGQAGIDALNNLNPLVASDGIFRSPPGELGGRNRTYRAQFGGDYKLADHTLSFQASYANTGTINRRDIWFGVMNVPGTVSITGSDIAIRENYYETRIASSQDRRLRYMLGLSSYDQRFRQGNTNGSVDFQDNSTRAVFGSIDYDITDALTLSVETRYSDEESLVILEGNPTLACVQDGGALTCNQKNDFTDFIPRVILSYQPFVGATAYASYSYSSLLGVPTQCVSVAERRPDLINPADCATIGNFTPPQENTQYELGWKQRGTNWTLTAAAYFIKWKNQPFAQIVILNPGTTSFRGPGDSEYTGFEFELGVAPTGWLDIAGALSHTSAEMTSFSSRGTTESEVLGSGVNSVVNDGNEPRNVPAWRGTLSTTVHGEYSGRDWFVRSDILYSSKSWADYSEFNRAPSQTLVNLRAGLEFSDRYRVEIYGKNLTEEKALGTEAQTTTGPGGNRKAFGEPYQRREFGIRLSADF